MSGRTHVKANVPPDPAPLDQTGKHRILNLPESLTDAMRRVTEEAREEISKIAEDEEGISPNDKTEAAPEEPKPPAEGG